jgi:hypothetical protein
LASDVEEYIKNLNQHYYAGYYNWRTPTDEELSSIDKDGDYWSREWLENVNGYESEEEILSLLCVRDIVSKFTEIDLAAISKNLKNH